MRNLGIKTKLVLFSSKTYKNGSHPVMLKATLGGKVKYHATGITALPSQWDAEKQHLYNIGVREAKEANADLEDLRDFAKHIIKTGKYQGENLTLDDFMHKLKGEGEQQDIPTVFNFFNKRIKQLKAVSDIGNASVYAGARNALVKFASEKLTFDKLTPTLLDDMEVWLRNGKNNPQGKPCNDGGVSYYMRTISALCTDAES